MTIDPNAIVTDPGKFEGEREVLRAAYQQYLEGFADDDGEVLTAEVQTADGPETIRFVEDDNGFIYELKETQ